MEAVGVVHPDIRSQHDRHPAKRVRTSHPGSNPSAATLITRPRGFGMHQDGHAQLQAPEADAISHSTGTETPPAHNDTGLQTSQAYHEPRLHNHNIGTARSGHYYVSTIQQHHSTGPVVGSSGNVPSAMSIPCVQPARENNLVPAASSPSLGSGSPGQSYNPSFQHQHQQQWSNPGNPSPSGDINGQPHFQVSPQSHQQPLPQPQSVPPPFIAVYPYSFVLPQRVHGLSAEHANVLSANVAVVAPGQATHTLPTHLLDQGQPQAGSGQDSHLHHHHQPQQVFFQPHQAPHDFEAGPSSFQAIPVAGLPLAALPYTPQFEQDHGSHYPHQKPHNLSPDSYFHTPMGGGAFIPGHQPALGDGSCSQPIDHSQNVHYIAQQGYPVGEVTATEATPAPHGIHPYRQTSDDGSADLQHQADYPPPGIYDDDVGDSTGNETSDASGDGDDDDETASRESLHDSESGMRQNKVNSGATKKRGAFSPDHRRQTAETRKIKACTRCRTQKMRCAVNPEDPNGPCLGCKSFSKTSKKTIHLTPCFRGKITDVVLYRCGGLDLTRRWTGTDMKDIGDRINPGDIRTIEFTLGICNDPIVVKVVAFRPLPGDVTARFWTVREGEAEVRKKKDLSQYCLTDIHKTADYFEKYVIKNAVDAMLRQRAGPVRLAGRDPALLGVVEKTYLAAIRHYQNLQADMVEGSAPELDREKNLLESLFIFWFATRHTTGSSWICGEETLNMRPETRDESYPLFGKISVPRMILAQFDSINHTRLLFKYGKKVLAELEALMMRNQPRWWFTIYLSLFILLREASWTSEDRYRHARNNYGRRMRYSIPGFVESLQEGCNNLLQHWHYYNCKPWPDPAAPWDRHKSFLAELSSEQYDLVMETMTDPAVQKQLNIWRRYKKENGYIEKPIAEPPQDYETCYQGSQSIYDWDHPLYWISQLFEEQWQAHPTYRREFAK